MPFRLRNCLLLLLRLHSRLQASRKHQHRLYQERPVQVVYTCPKHHYLPVHYSLLCRHRAQAQRCCLLPHALQSMPPTTRCFREHTQQKRGTKMQQMQRLPRLQLFYRLNAAYYQSFRSYNIPALRTCSAFLLRTAA